MSKNIAKAAKKGMQKAAQKVIHPPYLKTNIPAGEAVPAPPLGPQLGARNIQIGPFCKQFNDQTNNIKPGIPIPTYIIVNPNRTVTLKTYTPPVSYFLKHAAGARKLSTGPDDVAGKITLKHVYEIAKIKINDPPNVGMTMEEMCKCIIGSAHSCGIEVVRSLDSKHYAEFLEERKVRLEDFERDLEETRQAKLLRL